MKSVKEARRSRYSQENVNHPETGGKAQRVEARIGGNGTGGSPEKASKRENRLHT